MFATTPSTPAANVDAVPDETGRADAVTGRAAFFLGRGHRATARAVFTSCAPGTPPDPFTLACLPVGRRLLEAATAEDFGNALAELADAWTTAGYGYANLRDGGPLEPDPLTAPPPDGTPFEDCGGYEDCGECEVHRVPKPTRWAWYSYAFDGDRVLCFLPRIYHDTIHGGYWNTVHLAPGLPPRVELTPAGRTYGESYPATAALDLPALAVWIMAELTTLGRRDDSAIWSHIRYAAVVNTTLNEIRLLLFGLADQGPDESGNWSDHSRAFQELNATIQAHNWTNQIVSGDCRFGYFDHPVSAYDLPASRTRQRPPGTVTVVTDPRPFWP
ncbi:hypothetical protein [Amycolatopsis vastitatis]|uniref:Uncharacterized protein n=1 Tax=Amycolatopsis vastitatis TaxID=1905142 RepID=A0A229SLP1_9PSEU|nr:hypothetical protein [Amycolatopsis vastitatis]OXM59561.1 hypothetical protein CF165_47010 [Amycolatopsis vastitatis]